jgi:hypothetical protein
LLEPCTFSKILGVYIYMLRDMVIDVNIVFKYGVQIYVKTSFPSKLPKE